MLANPLQFINFQHNSSLNVSENLLFFKAGCKDKEGIIPAKYILQLITQTKVKYNAGKGLLS